MGGENAVTFYESYCKKFFAKPQSISFSRVTLFISRVINKVSRTIISRNIVNQYIESKQDYQHLLNVAFEIQADIIWLGFGNISYPLLRYIKEKSDIKVVLDTDSVWSRFILRGLPYAKDDNQYQQIFRIGQEKVEEENWGTKLADVTTAVSRVDAEYYQDLAVRLDQVHLFSNVIDIDSYQQVPAKRPDFHQPSIYLAGTFGPDSPMDDAARWIINQVLPLIRRQIPNIHFYIIGNGSDTTLSDIQDSQITITGKLDSVLPYLCHVNVALVPLRFESGTRFKILEAGACKVPVVSTTLGAEGIPVTHGHNILIADQPEDFARAVIKVIEDPSFARQMSDNLHSLIREKYSVDSLVHEGAKIIEYLYS
jgi:glycosyltransferase involved in cell wall biosynthesis